MADVPFADLVRVFGRIGLLSFGGPAAQIALMHRELVDERDWLSERQFLSALSFCMLLPGPEAMQLATYAGWKLRGVPGGVIAGALFVLPGALLIAVLALAYGAVGARPATEALLLGVKATVIVIVIEALVRVSKKALTSRDSYGIAASAFVAIFAFSAPFPLIIAAAGMWGFVRAQAVDTAPQPVAPPRPTPALTLAIWAALWLAPLPLLWLAGQTLLFDLALFFGKLAVVTFGGAYAVLAYMAQEVVQVRGWLDATQMVDALGLAETTPGPLILVTQFVGMLTGFEKGGVGLALAAGVVTLWMTFVPCFLWIFAGAPHVDALLARPRLNAALQAITAAVVGVILNLSLWFAMHVLFAQVGTVSMGPVTIPMPDPSSLDVRAAVLVGLAGILMGILHRGVVATLAISAVCGAVMSWF
ncbi:chromate efflux transporter [Thalassococcus sp. CAU 1522]|uniref:Chromate efflux transporter n=1 Tax=Thalassococcus arenae TaxID=2851652 RepID=A0ABS6NAU5_9RHOB|nr:chromate efflux transporter [Thalassococcus arenae]MBV2360913.1 chromate efflux transporter [Thalassococcus arenae]